MKAHKRLVAAITDIETSARAEARVKRERVDRIAAAVRSAGERFGGRMAREKWAYRWDDVASRNPKLARASLDFMGAARVGFDAAVVEEANRLCASIEMYRRLCSVGHWIALARRVAVDVAESTGAKVAGWQDMETEFVRWEVGGTYRHRARVQFDREIDYGHREGGHYRPGLMGQLFGRGRSSKSGVMQVAPNILEIFQDQ